MRFPFWGFALQAGEGESCRRSKVWCCQSQRAHKELSMSQNFKEAETLHLGSQLQEGEYWTVRNKHILRNHQGTCPKR